MLIKNIDYDKVVQDILYFSVSLYEHSRIPNVRWDLLYAGVLANLCTDVVRALVESHTKKHVDYTI